MRAVYLAGAWLAGIGLGSTVPVPWPSLALFSAAALSSSLLLRRTGMSWALALLPLVLLLGVARPQPLPWGNPTPPVAQYNDAGPMALGAYVAEDPDFTGVRVRVTLAAQWVEREGEQQPVQGKVLVFLSRSWGDDDRAPLLPGDHVVLLGALTTPPIFEEFDYQGYLARQGIGSVMFQPDLRVLPESTWSLQRALAPWRHRLGRSLEAALPDPEGAVARTVTLGLRGSLPPPITEAFRATGTSHLLAISGLHVALVMGMLLSAGEALLGRRRQLYLLLPLAGVWLYALLAGMAPSVTRAALMATLFLAALALGRQSSILNALALAAAVMVGINPDILGSVSFQLSFAAVAGIGLLFPKLREVSRTAVEGWHLPEASLPLALVLVDAVALSVAATAATIPLLAFHFQRFSLLSIPVTIALLPTLPPILLLSFVASLAGLLWLPLAQAIGWFDWVFLRSMLMVVRPLGELPGSSMTVQTLSPTLVWLYYGLLVLLGWLASRRPPLRQGPAYPSPRVSGGIALPAPLLYLGLFLVLVTSLLWGSVVQGDDTRLRVTFLDVGQGDATLIQSPDGHQVLIDGGEDPRLLLAHLSDRLPLLRRSLDLVVLTHPDNDHLLGLLAAVEEYPVGAVLQTSVPADSTAYLQWDALLQRKGVRALTATAGTRVTLGPQTVLEVLHPPDPLLAGTESDDNNNALVLRLTYGRASFLLPGDIEAVAEGFLVRHAQGLESTVLKVPHHGSATSTTTPFLETVAPLAAVVSVGEGNPYGHPNPQVMQRLQQQAQHVFTTAEHGSVEVSSDGSRLWVRPER